MKKRMLFVFNPKSGKGRIKMHLLDIVDIFNKGGYEVIIRATQGPKDAYEQVKEYADQVDGSGQPDTDRVYPCRKHQ